jgi:hypothetical protein
MSNLSSSTFHMSKLHVSNAPKSSSLVFDEQNFTKWLHFDLGMSLGSWFWNHLSTKKSAVKCTIWRCLCYTKSYTSNLYLQWRILMMQFTFCIPWVGHDMYHCKLRNFYWYFQYLFNYHLMRKAYFWHVLLQNSVNITHFHFFILQHMYWYVICILVLLN